MPRPHRLGEPYRGAHAAWPAGAVAVLAPGALELRLFVPYPRAEIVEAVRTGAVAAALVELPSTLVLAVRFGDDGDGVPWTLVPYVHVLAPGGRDGFPSWLRDARDVELRVLVVDAETALIHALRAVPLPPPAVRRLAAAIWRQLEEPGDPADAEAALAAAHDDPGALAALLDGPLVARFGAGDDDEPCLELPAAAG